jgi:ribonuclease D
MLLIQYTFHVQIIEFEKKLSQVEGKFKAMKEHVTVAKKEEAWKEEAIKKEEAKTSKQTTKDMLAKWWKNGGQQVCSKDRPLKM